MPGAVFSSLSVDAASPKSVSFTSPRVGDEHVGRRDVAVDQAQVAEAVRVAQAAAQLLDDVDGDVDREGHALLRAAVPHRAQVLALDEVHGQEQLAVDLAGVEHRDEVAVAELDHDLGLVAEARDVLGVGQVREHGLDDQQLLQAVIPGHGHVERTHATLRERREQMVLPELPRELLRRGVLARHSPRCRGSRRQDYHLTSVEPIDRGSPRACSPDTSATRRGSGVDIVFKTGGRR